MPPVPPITHLRWQSASLPIQRLAEVTSSPKLRVLKQDGLSFVLTSDDVVIKLRSFTTIFDRLRTHLGRGRLARQASGARTLDVLGIPTAQILGHGTAQIGGVPCEVLIMQRLAGDSLLSCLRDRQAPIKTEHAIADALGVQVARLTMAGWFNRDHKPSNLIVLSGSTSGRSSDAASAGHTSAADTNTMAPRIAIIDTVDILPVKPRHRFLIEAVRMLTSLMLEPIGCNCPPRLALRRRVLRALHQELWRMQGQTEDEPEARAISVSDSTEPSPSPAADSMDPEWESQSTRAIWNMTRDRIAAHLRKHGTARPRVEP